MGNFSHVSPPARLKPGKTAAAGRAVSLPWASMRYTAKPMHPSSFCPKLHATVMTSLLAKAMAFCIAGPPLGLLRVLSSGFQARVEEVSQGVAEHVEPEDGKGERHGRPDGEPRRLSDRSHRHAASAHRQFLQQVDGSRG